MTTNWMRRFELYLIDNQGRGIALSDFKVVFNINWFNDKLSRVATVTIYNLSVETNNRIMSKEFANIKILAGYSGLAPQPGSNSGVIRDVESSQDMPVDEENFGVIYNGEIRYTATGMAAILGFADETGSTIDANAVGSAPRVDNMSGLDALGSSA